MANLNLTFDTKHGHAVVSKNDIVSLEDIDDFSCAITIKYPNNQVHKMFSTERTKDLFERMQDIPASKSNFIERRKTIENTSNDILSYKQEV